MMKTILAIFVASTLLLTAPLHADGLKPTPAEELLDTPIADGTIHPDWTTFGVVLGRAPAIAPQADGVVCLNAEAAAIVRWNGKQAALVNGASGIRIEAGAFSHWDGENERPLWRVHLPAGGTYYVVINRSTTAIEEGAASLSFIGA